MEDEKMKNGAAAGKMALLAASLALLFILLTCFFQTRATQAAVLATFERPVATIEKPGLHFKMPWPVQKAYVFDTRIRLYQSPYFEALVKDGFNVVVRVYACWSIKDVKTYKARVGVTAAKGEAIISTLVGKYLKSALGEHSLSDIVGGGKDASFTRIEQAVLAQLSAESLNEYGIRVDSFGFDRFELPEDTTEAVFERMKSERMRLVEKISSEGKYKAMSIRKEADLAKSKTLAEAEAEAVKIRGEADTKAFEYLDVYNQQPRFALFLRKLQALENSMKTKTTVILDKDTPPFDMLTPDAMNKLDEPKR